MVYRVTAVMHLEGRTDTQSSPRQAFVWATSILDAIQVADSWITQIHDLNKEHKWARPVITKIEQLNNQPWWYAN